MNKNIYIKNDPLQSMGIIEKLVELGADISGSSNLTKIKDPVIFIIDSNNKIATFSENDAIYPLIIKNYKEVFPSFIPKDKQPVWGWDGDEEFTTNVGSLVFYDAENESTFSEDGERDGDNFDYYTPYRGTIEQWMKLFIEKIKDK